MVRKAPRITASGFAEGGFEIVYINDKPYSGEFIAAAPKLLAALERAVLTQSTFQKKAEEADKLKGGYNRYGMDNYFAEMFPLIESFRPLIAKAKSCS